MTFGARLRELRKAKDLSQRALADKVGINFTYLSKVESERLDFAQYPSEDLIRKLAKVLKADVDELLLLAKKIPPDIRERVIERPDAFRKIASLDDRMLDDILRQIEEIEGGQRGAIVRFDGDAATASKKDY
jgi:transcriptional regulator with XRE-family HTH domain